MKRLISTICLVALFAVQAQASITGVALGTAAPPPMVGPYTMTKFGLDPQPLFTLVPSVASPLGGTVGFSPALDHRMIGSGWATWSHGYTGDVYYTGGATSARLTMPALTGAFYLYAEPNPFSPYLITATAQDGTSISQMVDGSGGACGYGFWAASLISTIDVACDGADFAVGEFGIANVPEPTTICLLGLGALSLIRRKK
jgi:hypothetical protein